MIIVVVSTKTKKDWWWNSLKLQKDTVFKMYGLCWKMFLPNDQEEEDEEKNPRLISHSVSVTVLFRL